MTILTDDEINQAWEDTIASAEFSRQTVGRAVEASVLAKLAQRNSRPVVEVIHARVEKMTPDQLAAYQSARERFKLAQQEPVAWQVRLRCKANKNQAWSSWSECDERAAKAYQASVDEQWEYETRTLYTHPVPSEALAQECCKNTT